MLRLLKQLIVVVLFVLFAGCSGGGCSSGCSCGGITPLAEGFKADRRIENAASVRLTDSGIAFLEDNLGGLAGLFLPAENGMGGALTFDIPNSSGDYLIIAYDMCKGGSDPNADPPECIAEIDLANAKMQLDPGDPYNLRVHGKIPLRVQKLPLQVKWFGIFNETVNVAINSGGKCPGKAKPFAQIGVDITIQIQTDEDQMHSRYGYSRIRVGEIKIDEDDVLNSIAYCNGGFSGAVLNAVDGLVIGMLVDGLMGTLDSTLEEALCQAANPDLDPPCPTGTVNVEGICRYGNSKDDECASMILGLDGNIDLGGLLASISPGTKGGFDFLFAVGGHSARDDGSGHHWGDLNPIGGGISLGMYGGSEPTPISGCVTQSAIELPTGVPIPDEILQNTVSDWPEDTAGPHFGLALNERFTNYLLAQAYNSGALCLGISADALGPSVPLNTALIGVTLGASSLNELSHQKLGSPIGIVLRPQQPPTITFGSGSDIATDPSIRLQFNQVSFDFYVWSSDRYLRGFTATMDLDVPMNLIVTPDGLQPAIDKLGVKNAKVTNSALIREDPQAVADSLGSLLESMVGSLLGDALPPIDVNEQLSSLGLTLDIPPTVEGKGSPGLRKLSKGSDNYLGIFAALGIAEQQSVMKSDTTAELISLTVDPDGLRVATTRPGNGPRAELSLGSSLDDGSHRIEWQYKLNRGPWHPFTTKRTLVVDDEILRAEGKHVVQVRSRVVGQVYSLDTEPARLTLIVDGREPRIRIVEDAEGQILVRANDTVSGEAGTKVRVRFGHDDGSGVVWDDWSEWIGADVIAPLWPEDATDIEVEAQDEDGNIATVSQALRGRGDGADGCTCTVLPHKNSSGSRWAWLFAAALAAAALSRRRRRRTSRSNGKLARQLSAAASLLLIMGMSSGCSCSGDETTTVPAKGCRGRGDCEALWPGLVGSYTSVATGPAGELWVAGYLEANWEDGYSYGDLVVGKMVEGQVQWMVVDGVDETEEVDEELYDPLGFRGGRVDAGFDVGLWTSIVVDSTGSPSVAYYDKSNQALKYARLEGEEAEAAWVATTVQGSGTEKGDYGRYAKLLLVGGLPTIAYLYVEPGDKGSVNSGVRLAQGNVLAASQVQWSFEDVVGDATTPCTGDICASGEACVISTGKCAEKKKDCDPECMEGKCVAVEGGSSKCEPVRSGGSDNYPDAVGLYVSAALRPDGGVGIAYYDRVHGNLVVAAKSAQNWVNVVADGQSGDTNTGDKGIGASLFIDGQGNYHLAYVDGLDEALNYVMVEGGTTPQSPEVVDTGLGNNDGQHLVGDDSDIFFTQGGEVHISYHDATAGKLRFAVGTPAAGKHEWVIKTIEQDGFAGFFSHQIEYQGSRKILNWWRVASPASKGDVRFVTP